MGHIYDRNSAFVVPPVPFSYYVSAGAVTFTTPKSGVLWYVKAKAGGAGGECELSWTLGRLLYGAAGSQKGFYLRTVNLWLYNAMAVTTLDTAVYLTTLPADGAAWPAATSQAHTYDAAHDTNGERVAGGYHKITLSITAPFWLETTKVCHFKYGLVLGVNGEIYLLGARVNGYLRW